MEIITMAGVKNKNQVGIDSCFISSRKKLMFAKSQNYDCQ